MTDSVAPISAAFAVPETVTQAIARLRQRSQQSIQPDWRWHSGDGAVPTVADWQHWAIAPLNDRQHVAWEKGQRVLWLAQRIVVPAQLHDYPLQGLSLRLSLLWWAKSAQIFVNGALVQEGDLFDCATRILLSPSAQPGDAIDVALRLVSPGHDDGALVRSLCVYESDGVAPEPAFVADELTVLQHYLSALQPEKLETLAAACASIDWSALPDRPRFDRCLAAVRQQLQPLGDWLKQRHVYLLGHAHLDLAWLWTVSETWEAAERTFRSVLQLQQDLPELIFCHSSPALYDWIEANRPALFAAIRDQIAAGRWEVVAGLWVEPELNLIGGESIARQVLYGQRYVQQRFGTTSKIAWLPDSFGFCWQLPQILKQGGVECFVTQKLRWNDSTEFPHELFWWRSPDGSEILSLHSAPIGEGIDPAKISRYAATWEAKTALPAALWLPGVGDHGGGPTRDMLETARRWQRSPLFPRLEFSTAAAFLDGCKTAERLPVWDDELYLEFHRGCYTTHADQKRSNRRCEVLLYQAELFASIATLATGAAYPAPAIEAAWKLVLFNQFHDILPGSAIPAVFDDANQAWQQAEQQAAQVLQQSLQTIAAHIDLPAPPQPDAQPIAVFNPLNWQRSEVVQVSLPAAGAWQVRDAAGEAVATQPDSAHTLLFWAEAVPAIGYRVFWLCPAAPLPIAAWGAGVETLAGGIAPTPPPLLNAVEDVLENDWLRVRVDSATGDLASVFDKANQREVLSGAGNQLQAFRDEGQYWDAWNIDPNYAHHPLPPAKLLSIDRLTAGPLQSRLRVTRQIGRSTIVQDYVLERSAVLKIETSVDWQERKTLLKAAFPLNLTSQHATYEMPFGAIARPTQPTNSREAAKWEVPALQWADLSTPAFGVSLLNDCKHGYDSQPSQLRLTLLRSPEWPNPHADRGEHRFTYALYPHSGGWQAAETVRRASELNQPLRVVAGQIGTQPQLPPIAAFLHLNADNLVLTAFKRSETDPDRWMLRCYECHGSTAEPHLTGDLGLVATGRTNLLEEPTPAEGAIAPWQIVTFAAKAEL